MCRTLWCWRTGCSSSPSPSARSTYSRTFSKRSSCQAPRYTQFSSFITQLLRHNSCVVFFLSYIWLMVKCHVSDWKDSFIPYHLLIFLVSIMGVTIFNILDSTACKEVFWKKLVGFTYSWNETAPYPAKWCRSYWIRIHNTGGAYRFSQLTSDKQWSNYI